MTGAVSALTLAVVPLLALGIDRWLGEPPARCHPVVWMGTALGWAGRRIAPACTRALNTPDYPAFRAGAAWWTLGAALTVAITWGLQALVLRLPDALAMLALAALLKPLLAWRMLQREVAAVESALAHSLDAGRARLARIVSRDVHTLSAGEVRASALESLAENLNDSLVAPLFWFALLGLPGAALFRFANTADAMWGYRGLHHGRDWTWAGRWAARADDVLAWLPARLTALLLGLAARWRGWRRLPAEARRTPSPNGGWPMGALALILGVRLSKPGVYALNPDGRTPAATDTPRALHIAGRASVYATLLACLGVICTAPFLT